MGLDRRGCVVQPRPRANRRREELVDKAKPFNIPKWVVWKAFKRVKANRGAAGVDRQSIAGFEADLSNNLYKLWKSDVLRELLSSAGAASGDSERDGGMRPLGIPTVADRIAQEVARRYLEPRLEPVFHADSASICLLSLPATSPKALTSISRSIRRWALHHHSDKSLQGLAKTYNPYIEGWINYYGQFYRTQLRSTLKRIDVYVIRWARLAA